MTSQDGASLLKIVSEMQDRASFQELNWTGTFTEYLEIVSKNPKVARNAFQRVYDMIMSYGTEEFIDAKKRLIRYRFFSDSSFDADDAIFGLEVYLMRLVNFFKAASQGYGTERRVLLLHGPVGSSKSTIARRIKRGLEHYSRIDDGAVFTYDWYLGDVEDIEQGRLKENDWEPCPMHEDPFHLIPIETRERFIEQFNSGRPEEEHIFIKGDLCPSCRYNYREIMLRYNGDWNKVIKHIRVRRLVFAEQDRVGIGTFQPKDEKNQDSTELTGDINYRKIAIYGSDSDPRAFNFDGEFNIANRGIIEFIEMLKLDVAFLYDLLGASQEHKIKSKKFAQTDIDEVIIGHTNEPEYRRLENNEFMEALKDRTVRIDIPYITRLSDEIRIYERDFNRKKVRAHIAPHTLEMAAMWAVLTRLEEPKKPNLTLLQKLKLYNGRTLPGFTEDNIKELRKESQREGMEGVSPRYVQDKISNALVSNQEDGYINPFMVLSELEGGLKNHSLVNSEEDRKRYRDLISVVREEYTEIVKNEVQRAISADEEAITRLCANYIDNIKSYTQRERVRNKYTGQYEEPDERLMRSIEEKIDIPESRKDDFRREIMNYIGALAIEGKTFNYRTNERLHRALELKLFEDQKDSIKLTSLVSRVIDKDTQERIDVVKSRLIRDFGYNEQSASDILTYVASIFARGDTKN
ncbi:MAG: serine protein kinase [Chloroflexi bacterium AL-W]|nr:serine protein kinase [Chloroflexi bacterium AL-N1]NOK67020.1 serine protein kinase [Chloroflexi bacterium AL-N10]NOK74688.1 serine protein kinase [Chloroflexi bacterium AL-N5]NOK81622.1 serine protein kinase [Chloroflexi bacterium AL-W]NOK89092.1 serine protein kinase [Chloroflexi bacterium AL-N15]